jgi:hypothetical protein
MENFVVRNYECYQVREMTNSLQEHETSDMYYRPFQCWCRLNHYKLWLPDRVNFRLGFNSYFFFILIIQLNAIFSAERNTGQILNESISQTFQ